MKENESFDFTALIEYDGKQYSIKCKKTRVKNDIVIDANLNIPISYIHGCHTVGAIQFTYSPPNRVMNILSSDEMMKVVLIKNEVDKIALSIGEQVPHVPTRI